MLCIFIPLIKKVMAIVQTSALISDIRGSINGTTFQRGNGGLIMRNKPLNVGRGSNAQQKIKDYNSILNNAWLSLSEVKRNVWAAFSNYTNGNGLTTNKVKSSNTGKAQFYTVNFWLLTYGKEILIQPTFNVPETIVIPCPPFYDRSTTLQNYVGNLDTTKQILITRVSLHQSISTKTSNTGFRTLVYTQVDGDTQDWTTAFTNVYGVPLIANKKYWISYQVLNFITGSISAISKSLVLYNPSTTGGIGFMEIGSTFVVS